MNKKSPLYLYTYDYFMTQWDNVLYYIWFKEMNQQKVSKALPKPNNSTVFFFV